MTRQGKGEPVMRLSSYQVSAEWLCVVMQTGWGEQLRGAWDCGTAGVRWAEDCPVLLLGGVYSRYADPMPKGGYGRTKPARQWRSRAPNPLPRRSGRGPGHP